MTYTAYRDLHQLTHNKMTIKFIGIKDTKDNNVTTIKHNKKLPKNFWDNWKLKNISFNVGDTMARMIVQKNGT